jgi:nucleoside 2-deoxyribosyltransferase
MREKPLDVALGNRIIGLRERVVANFDAGNWEELGLLTGGSDLVDGHHRLLRSLSWGDEDYAGNALSVLREIIERDMRTLPVIESYLDEKFPGEAHYISAKPAERKITFAPHVFQVPDGYVELDLASVMMPFAKEFAPTHEAIKRGCKTNGLRCQRVDDIWEESAIVQDIFNLIFRAQVVIVDFTGKNPNVMYETGIAHTLGKHVIPITQSLADVPFDMRHHRTLVYLPNQEGFAALETALAKKLQQFAVTPPTAAPSPPAPDDNDIPF